MALPIERINSKLEGTLRYRGKEHSIPFALPGDQVSFQVQRRGRRGYKLHVETVEPAESYPEDLERAEPFCPYFAVCGGCRGQHLSYETQLRLKTAPILERMRSEFQVEPELVAAPKTRGHRNRMDFVVNGGIIGLRPAGRHEAFVDLETCAVQTEAANAALGLCREILGRRTEVGFRREAEGEAGGPLKYITIRAGQDTGVIVLTIVRPEEFKGDHGLFLKFRSELQDTLVAPLAGIDFALVEASTDRLSEVSNPSGGAAIRGEAGLKERLGGLDFFVPYDAFFQPNPEAFDRLLDWSLTQVGPILPEAPAKMMDVYCGAGVLSAILAHRLPGRFAKVTGFEFTESAVLRAPENLRAAGFTGEVDFRALDLNTPPEDLFADGADLIVLDPPRAGLSPKLRKRLLKQKPAPYLLYVSCNPTTQLHDMEVMREAYQPLAACLVDCYPQTGHLEQAVLLRARGPRDSEQSQL